MLHVNECVQTDNRIRVIIGYMCVCMLFFLGGGEGGGGGGLFPDRYLFFFFLTYYAIFPIRERTNFPLLVPHYLKQENLFTQKIENYKMTLLIAYRERGASCLHAHAR